MTNVFAIWRVLTLLCVVVFAATCTYAQARDTLRLDDGTFATAGTASNVAEELMTFQPSWTCTVVALQVFYGSGSGRDTIIVTNDPDGTWPGGLIPSKVRNDNAMEVFVDVQPQRWITVLLPGTGFTVNGFDHIGMYHRVSTNQCLWGMDAENNARTSNVQRRLSHDGVPAPSDYMLAQGDFMVRLIVEFAAIAPSLPSFIDVTKQANLVSSSNQPFMRSDASIVDINGDGWDDIIVGTRVFVNTKDMTFNEVAVPFEGEATSWADVDGDGDMDCYSYGSFGSGTLWRNEGNASFVRFAGDFRLSNRAPTVSVAWSDFNKDNLLDAFIVNGFQVDSGRYTMYLDALHLQHPEGRFVNASLSSGSAAGEPSPFDLAYIANLCDYNNDGHVDVFVSPYVWGVARLMRNRGPGAKMSGDLVGVSFSTTVSNNLLNLNTLGSQFADMNGDGWQDLITSGLASYYAQDSSIPGLRLNQGQASPFQTRATPANGGLPYIQNGTGLTIADFDHDGRLDVWQGNDARHSRDSGVVHRARIYRNNGTVFVDRSWLLGIDHHGAWTSAIADLDHDGDLDLVSASSVDGIRVYRNDASSLGSSIVVRLRDTTKNTQAFGARVALYSQSHAQHRWNSGTVSGGLSTQSPNDLHFGLGAASVADSIAIVWPDGVRQVYSGPFTGGATWTFLRGQVPSIAFDHHPALLGPANGSYGIGERVRCRWRSPKPVVLEFSTSSDFSNIFRRHGPTSETSVNLTFPVSTDPVYWRARFADDSTKQSATWMFRTGSMPPVGGDILLPEHNGALVRTSFEATWQAFRNPVIADRPTIRYNIRIHPLESPSQSVVDVREHADTSLMVSNLVSGTDYEMVVAAYDDSPRYTTSVVRRFRALDPPEAPVLLQPRANALDVSRTPRFSVSRVVNADQYEIHVDREASFASPIRQLSASETFLFAEELQILTDYVWRVRASNAAGAGEWSNVQRFATGTTTGVIPENNLITEYERVLVYDLRGTLLVTSQASTPTEWTNRLPPGVYLLHFVDSRGQIVDIQLAVRSSP